MATRFHIAAKELKGPIDAYAKRFDFLEVHAGGVDDKHAMTPAAMKRWRKAVPPHFDFSVIVGPNVARLKPSRALEEELDRARSAIDALQARCVLIATPADVTPSPLWRDRMGKLLERLPHDATNVIWEPGGLWEVGDAAVAAKKWNVVLAVDASRDPVPVGNVAYIRLPAMGETRSYGASALEKVVESVGNRRDAYVVLETTSALAEAKRIRQIAQGTTRSAEGGTGRVLRPRSKVASVKVRDDEQE